MSPPKPKVEIQRQNRLPNKSNGVSKTEKMKLKTTERFDYGNYNRYGRIISWEIKFDVDFPLKITALR
jgi:hypothetical protein